MRKIFAIATLCALAGIALAAGERREIMTVTVGTNGVGGTNYLNGITGKINEVLVDVNGTGATGDLAVVIVPELTTMSVRNIYTNAVCTADVISIPRVQGNGVNGAVISGVYDKYSLINESIRMIWSNSGATGVTAKVIVKYEKE